MRRRPVTLLVVAVASLLTVGCSHSTTNGGGGSDMAGVAGSGGGGGGGGGNAVTGTTPQGGAFGPVAAAWLIGHPDSAATTVIYMFNHAVDCHDATIKFGAMGWDMNLPANTQFIELKAFGTAATPPTPPGDYTVTTSMNPTTGEASINHSLAPGGGAASNENIGNGGKITIATISAANVKGSFTIAFPTPPGGTLTGTFDAGLCDIGVEP